MFGSITQRAAARLGNDNEMFARFFFAQRAGSVFQQGVELAERFGGGARFADDQEAGVFDIEPSQQRIHHVRVDIFQEMHVGLAVIGNHRGQRAAGKAGAAGARHDNGGEFLSYVACQRLDLFQVVGVFHNIEQRRGICIAACRQISQRRR